MFASGGTTNGQVLNLAARHKDGQWLMVYLGSRASFSVNLDRLAATEAIKAIWVDPRTGQSVPALRLTHRGVESFSIPEGGEDALLILEASGG